MTEFRCGVRARVFPLLCAVALLVPDLIAARVTSGAIDVVHYDVEVKPDFDQRTITGRTTIRFRSLESSLSEVSFSPNAMSIDEARMNGTALRVVRATDSIAVRALSTCSSRADSRDHVDATRANPHEGSRSRGEPSIRAISPATG